MGYSDFRRLFRQSGCFLASVAQAVKLKCFGQTRLRKCKESRQRFLSVSKSVCPVIQVARWRRAWQARGLPMVASNSEQIEGGSLSRADYITDQFPHQDIFPSTAV